MYWLWVQEATTEWNDGRAKTNHHRVFFLAKINFARNCGSTLTKWIEKKTWCDGRLSLTVLFGCAQFIFFENMVKNWLIQAGLTASMDHFIAWVTFYSIKFKACTRSLDSSVYAIHDDVIEWKHFPRYWPFVTKASDAELWYFLCSAPEQTVSQTIERPVIWGAITRIMASL